MANKFFFMNGGSERVFFQEREFLKEQGHTVIDFSMEDRRNFPSNEAHHFVPNVDYQATGGIWEKAKQGATFIHSPIAVEKIEQLILQHQPEIAHLHNVYHQLTPSIIKVLNKYDVKVVLTLHDYKLICPSYLAMRNETICTECEGRHFLKPLLTNCQNSRSLEFLLSIEAMWHKWRKSYEGVDCFIAPSHFLADLTRKRIPSNKMIVLPNGIKASNYQQHYEGSDYALFFGRLSKEKGINTLLIAHDKLPQNIPLKVVGTGPLADELQQAYPKAIFMGYQSGHELNDLISKAAFVIVPSGCYENCSMVVLEAMAYGKPIIGSRIGGISEQINDGETGVLFEMGNVDELQEKILKLWMDKDLRIRMGKAAREKLEKEYSFEKHCKELLAIYDDLLAA